MCKTEYKEVCKPVYKKPTYQTAAFHGKECEKVPEEKCQLVDENICSKVPEKVCQKVKDKKCLTIPEETCRDIPSKNCEKVQALVPVIQKVQGVPKTLLKEKLNTSLRRVFWDIW